MIIKVNNLMSPRMSKSLKGGMYLLSLWLLFILIIVNKIQLDICFGCRFASISELLIILKNNYLPGLCVIFLMISYGFYLYFNRLIYESKDGPLQIKEIEDKNAEHLIFLATYVIPLVGFGLDNYRQVINLGITLLILGAIYVKTDLFYANPTLSLLGFKIFYAEFEGLRVVLIAKEDLVIGDSVNVLKLDRKIFFAKKAMSY